MSARQKLNAASFLANLLCAGLAGLIVESWLAFVLALGVLCALSVHSGDIRMTPRR